MKVRIVGKGRVPNSYLTYGKVYDAEIYPYVDRLVNIKDDDGDTILIRVSDTGYTGFCGHISDGDNDLRWEVVDE